jgi:predicted nucleic acid-binding protein
MEINCDLYLYRRILARHLSQDQYHRQVNAFWDSIRKKNETCVTSNFVLDETSTLLGYCAGYSFVVQRARNIYASESLNIFRPSREDELKAIDFFKKYSDNRLSFTDCVSFILMQNRKIKRVFTFDHHFQLVGFQTYPKR